MMKKFIGSIFNRLRRMEERHIHFLYPGDTVKFSKQIETLKEIFSMDRSVYRSFLAVAESNITILCFQLDGELSEETIEQAKAVVDDLGWDVYFFDHENRQLENVCEPFYER